MSLKFYRELMPGVSTELDAMDTATGTGSQTNFPLVNKAGNRIGSTIQFGTTQYFKFNGGFSISGNTVITNIPPQANTQGVLPGVTALVMSAYDTDNVPGVTNPRIHEVPFWLFDISEIPIYQYENRPDATGIEICFVDNISSVGAQISWVQLACADSNGNALTYLATGACLYTPNISLSGTLLASSGAGATSIQVTGASSFIAGDYICINAGLATQELRQIVAINGAQNLLIITGATDFSHVVSEKVYTCGRKFWAKLTVPLNAAGGLATNLYDLSLRCKAKRLQRL